MANKKARGYRANTRAKIRGAATRPTVNQLLQTFDVDETVQIVINGTIHAGMPFRRFHGLTGQVIGHQGRAVKVKAYLGNQTCIVILNPIHLKRLTTISKKEAKVSA
ncbi:MAG: 50S ribosomal protein L21e [Candidatus Diapherotrites archaeon]|nr:50S ribosomal protein L21e [Candidatus Diapherotrites archaeon]MDZ4256049.1 50S ribosomal protein L21e [archaeon]